MKNLSLLVPIPSQLAWIAIISMLALSSCKTTITSTPSNLASTSTSTERNRPLKKRSKKLFQKKVGDARADFQRDLKAGRLKLKQHGAPSSITPYYNQILKNDLGIKTEVIAEGIVDIALLRYAKEYNALMTVEIERKYGPGILQKAYYRARVMEQQVRQSGR